MKARIFYGLFMLFGFVGMVLDLLAKGSKWLGHQSTTFSEWCGYKASCIDATLFPTKDPRDGS